MMLPETFPGPALEILAAADDAVRQLPPAWPLAATVAVNPWLGQSGEPVATAAARLARVAGAPLTAPRAEMARRIAEGAIIPDDLRAGCALLPPGLVSGPEALAAAARRPAPPLVPLPTVADLAAGVSGHDWPALIAERIGLWAGGHFDRGQALWPAPEGGAWDSWRSFASRDLTPEIQGLTGFAASVAAAPASARAAIVTAAGQLGLTADAAPTAFHRLLMTMGGWAQLARGLGWVAEQAGGREATAADLLAIRLTWEVALLRQFGDRIAPDWEKVAAAHAAPVLPEADLWIDLALQEAANRAAERSLAETLSAPRALRPEEGPAIQAAFCIDVRSEVFRRALESADDGVATLGFAGFFGLPVRHHAAASDVAELRAPVLLTPGVDTAATLPEPEDVALRIHRRAARAWGRFKMAAVSSFAFVEAAGPLHAGKLVKGALGRKTPTPEAEAPRPDLPLADRVAAAARILRAMSLTSGFAPLVLIAGHGAAVVNAPFASALQCGACGGHAGDVNARLLAGLLNEVEVRAGLVAEGIEIPRETVFVAGLHDTTSDRLTLFTADLPEGHGADLDRLARALEAAGHVARTERALRLPGSVADDLKDRGGDWAEQRPEWGLAGCAAFIAAPREVTVGRDLGGRAFLHDYDWRQDDGFATLELILTAPVVVASWIALQYHGSSVAPEVFGAGNKLLHNVTGGLGVVEGNGGALRTGLPWQSVHDGARLMHDPVRLSVALAAPAEAISAVLSRHPGVAALFDNGWLSLHALDEAGRLTLRYEGGAWRGAMAEPSRAVA